MLLDRELRELFRLMHDIAGRPDDSDRWAARFVAFTPSEREEMKALAARELRDILVHDLQDTRELVADCLNCVLRKHDVEEVSRFVSSNEDFQIFSVDCPPVNVPECHHVFDMIVHDSGISQLRFYHSSPLALFDEDDLFFDDDPSWDFRDLVAWVGSRDTLVGVTSLESVSVETNHMSDLDCSALFPLLLTSASLHEFEFIDNGCDDKVINDVSWYVASASLQKFKFGGTKKLSEEFFVILCEGVAFSRVRRFDLCLDQFQGVGLETMVEWLALTIRVSSLEEVRMVGCLGEKCGCIGMVVSALRRTDPVQNMDFTFTQTGMDFTFSQTDHRGQRILEINQKLKPLVFGADICWVCGHMSLRDCSIMMLGQVTIGRTLCFMH
jgi:hypothetical protein